MRISSISCDTYDPKTTREKIERSLEILGGIEKFVGKDDTVLLKPNLLSPVKPETGIITNPVIIDTIIDLIKETGAEVKVGESSGGMTTNTSLTKQSFVKSGLKQVCEDQEVELINFDKVESKTIKVGDEKKRIPFPKPLLESDVIISVPKIKTHSLTLFTGSIKNLYGCIPGGKKAEFHKTHPNPREFSKLIVDIFEFLDPDLAIMDGVEGLEGNGPGERGEKFHLGCLLASSDLVALDTLAASYLGYNEDQVPINNIASNRELGTNKLQNIKVKGDFKAPEKKRNLPSNQILSLVPNWLIQPFSEKLMTRPKINSEECILCKRCLNSCPQQVISEKDGELRINQKNCIKCLCCQEVCPEGAIDINEPFLIKTAKKFF